jgi:hypothetical protein
LICPKWVTAADRADSIDVAEVTSRLSLSTLGPSGKYVREVVERAVATMRKPASYTALDMDFPRPEEQPVTEWSD